MLELRERLNKLSSAEREAALSYYEEYFDEAGPEREQDVIRELGSPAALASRILADHAVKEARNAPLNPRKGLFGALVCPSRDPRRPTRPPCPLARSSASLSRWSPSWR